MSDAQWSALQVLLPPEPVKRGRGMPHAPFRCIMNSILYVLITGSRWCDLPEAPHVFASKSSAHRWLLRWSEDGVLERMAKDITAIASIAGMIDWKTVSVDGTFSLGQGRR